MLDVMRKNWWMIVARGVFAVLFGVLALVVPGITLTALVLLFGAYVLVDGGFSIYSALAERHDNTWIGLLEGAIGVIAGVLTFIWPGITGIILLYLIAAWAILTGVVEIIAAIRLRDDIENDWMLWMLGITGLLSLAFGFLLIISPVSGAIAVAWGIGLYGILFGVTMIALGLRLRSSNESIMATSS